MPAELRRQVLSHVDDVHDLMALVTASPVFYQQSLLEREALVIRTTIATLGDILVDAYAVHTSDLLYQELSRPYPRQDIFDYIDNYVAMRAETPEKILERCTNEALVDMVRFYHSVARPLVVQLSTLLRQALGPRFQVGDPSPMEQNRILRAIYRFQLHCNIFGEGNWGYHGVVMAWQEQLSVFFAIFESGEIQDIVCIYTLIESKYQEMFAAVRWRGHGGRLGKGTPYLNLREECELLPTNKSFPRFFGNRQRPLFERYQTDSSLIVSHESSRNGTPSRGLRLFYTILKTRNQDALVRRMQQHAIRNPRFDPGRVGTLSNGIKATDFRVKGRHQDDFLNRGNEQLGMLSMRIHRS